MTADRRTNFVDVRAETAKIEASGIPAVDDGIEGEPQEDAVFTPVTTDTGSAPSAYVPPFGLMLTTEVMAPGVTTYGDLLNSIAAAWRGREEVPIHPGSEGAIKDEFGAPIGLWMIAHQ